MKSYYRVMLGKKSVHAAECFQGGFIGADSGIAKDLSGKLPDEWRDFNQAFIPIYLAQYPEKTKIAAGLACGFLWTISKGIKKGDIVLCPDAAGSIAWVKSVGTTPISRASRCLIGARCVGWAAPSTATK